MAAICLDTSALFRRYAPAEPGADRVLRACDPEQGHTLIMSRLVVPEVASALAAKARTGELSSQEREALWGLFLVDVARQYRVIHMAELIWDQANSLLFRHTLRAADALHVASALFVAGLQAGSVEFWTADERQARAARDEGLPVEFLA